MPSSPFILPCFIFLLGLCVGSFCNVAIYRLPIGLSLWRPARSFCPRCKESLAAWFNIPLISYLLLRGKCRYCKAPISFRYPLVETAAGMIFLLTFNRYGFPLFFVDALWLSSLVVIAAIDMEHLIIPDAISLPGIVAGILLSLFSLVPVSFADSILGALAGAFLFYCIAFLSRLYFKREGLGGGDIKFIAMIGAFLGWPRMLLTIFLSSLTGSVTGIILQVLGKKERKSTIPFGPFLAMGGAISLFWGDEMIRWYLKWTFANE